MNGKKTFKRTGFNLVSYDGAPERVVEPISEGIKVTTLGQPLGSNYPRILDALTDHGQIGGFEFIDGTYWPNTPEGKVHRF